MEMNIYISSKDNEGNVVGSWFNVPLDYEDIKEKIGVDLEQKEYTIQDYNLPFDIKEDTSIEEINRLCALAEELEGTPIERELREIQKAFFSSFDELVEHAEEIIYYNCNDMSQVASYFVEKGLLGEIPEKLKYYIDYELYGSDLETEGNFLVTSTGIFEYIG